MHAQSLPRLKAPREHGALLSFPPLDDAATLLADNRARAAGATPAWEGRSLAELRTLARQEVLSIAHAYLQEAGEPAPAVSTGPWLVAGHQPELFHPGVWVKNFAMNGLGRLHHLTPVNLVVDNDTNKSSLL